MDLWQLIVAFNSGLRYLGRIIKTRVSIFMTMDANFDVAEFRNALGSFTTGVTIVTTQGNNGNDVGLTANSFNSVSLDPPMVLWSLGKSALSMTHFQTADHFAVHILAQDQQDLSQRFATRGIDKFSDLDISRGPNNVPLLEQCAARFICKTVYQYEGGDHIIFVGEVISFEHSAKHPLLFHKGQYGQLSKSLTSVQSDSINDFQNKNMGFLLRYCSHKLLGKLKQEIVKHDINFTQYTFLSLVSKSLGNQTLEQFISQSEEGDNCPTQEDVDYLIEKNLLRLKGSCLEITELGSRLHLQLVAHYKAAESSALELLDYDERQTLHIALSKVAAAFTE